MEALEKIFEEIRKFPVRTVVQFELGPYDIPTMTIRAYPPPCRDIREVLTCQLVLTNAHYAHLGQAASLSFEQLRKQLEAWQNGIT